MHPALVRAAVSPTALVVTAAGAGIGVLDHSVVLAVVLAAVGWTGRMAAAVFGRRRRERAGRPHPAELDPWSVPEPWRQLLRQAASAQSRFDQLVAGWRPGPTRERLLSLQPQIYGEIADLGTMAHHGAAAAGWTGAMADPGRPSAEGLAAELERARVERAHLGQSSGGQSAPARAAELARHEEAVAAQLRAYRHSEQVAAEIQDRLRQAVARLDESITGLLALDAGGPAVPSALDELTDGITSLRAALSETSGAPPEP